MSAELVNFSTAMHSRMPVREYRSIAATNITLLKELRRSPLHYLHRRSHAKESNALRLGTAAHVAVLEPERFDTQFAIWGRRASSGNLCPRNGRHWEEFQRIAAGKEIITSDDAERALQIQAAVRNDVVAMRYLEAGDPEVVMTWTIRGRPCKGRADWLTVVDNQWTVVGLKTARDARPLQFGNACARLGYHLQWSWYHDGFQFIKAECPRLVEIVVEPEPPYPVVTYTVPDDVIQQGRDEYMVLLEQLERCEASGVWPGPAEGEIPVSLPSWVYEANDDLSELGLEE